MNHAPASAKESNVRSLLKAVSWRVIATLTTIAIAWLVFGDIEPALAIGGIEFVAKFFVYYGHERLWQIIPRGTFRRRSGGEEGESSDQTQPWETPKNTSTRSSTASLDGKTRNAC